MEDDAISHMEEDIAKEVQARRKQLQVLTLPLCDALPMYIALPLKVVLPLSMVLPLGNALPSSTVLPLCIALPLSMVLPLCVALFLSIALPLKYIPALVIAFSHCSSQELYLSISLPTTQTYSCSRAVQTVCPLGLAHSASYMRFCTLCS